jgi:quercetin dioxygenase-like cupin family protein
MTTNRSKAIANKQIENEKVIITEWRFEPGAETGWHKHHYDYIVVPGMNGNLILETTSGESLAELQEGQSYYRSQGVEHNVINANDFEFYFVEIELKQR